jgi:hypothetical protein
MLVGNAKLKIAGDANDSPERRIQRTPISIKILR